jgi:hypothetical protein
VKDTWFFYHDALTLMTAKDTIEWMKEKYIYHRWILPASGLHTDDKELAYYNNKPCGNSPENMPWDTSLNNDVHKGVERHIALTLELAVGCDGKFDMSTPLRGASAYKRILDYVPSSERIIQDVENVFVSMEIVRQADGILIDSLGKNYGRRYQRVVGLNPVGGKRQRKQAYDDYGDKDVWIHPDAEPSVMLKREHSVQRNAGVVETKPLSQKMKL